jgi:hypothetical protein
LRLGGNAYLFFFLIVFTLAMLCAWKKGVLLWIPGCFDLRGADRDLSQATRGAKRKDAARVGHREIQMCYWSATGKRKKDKRLKKETVVPVVQAGKVEIRVKSCVGNELRGGRVF